MPQTYFLINRCIACLLALFALVVTGCAQYAPPREAGSADASTLRLERQGSFFVGGRDVNSEDLSTFAAIPAKGTITVDQVYVRYQVPAVQHKKVSITFIHGCCLTGKTWETTPDGRMGWDEFFLRRGHPVYLIDQAWRGRSAASPAAINAVKAGKTATATIPTYVAAGREAAWEMFRFGPRYSQAFPGQQFPLESQAEFWKQMVPDWAYSLPTPNPTVPALSELAKKIGPTLLVSHSQSGIYPFQAVALDPTGIAAIVAVEPGGCPGKDVDMTPYKRIPTLILFGDYVEEVPYWSGKLKACREFAQAASAAGARVQVQVLPEMGIKGNTHMLMQDRNSLELAGWLEGWIERNTSAVN